MHDFEYSFRRFIVMNDYSHIKQSPGMIFLYWEMNITFSLIVYIVFMLLSIKINVIWQIYGKKL